MTKQARARFRALAVSGFDEPARRWLISPLGLLAACQEAVADEDAGFFDEVAASPLLARLDDESLRTAGPRPSDRASALICAGRLAHWCLTDGVDPTPLPPWLEVAVRGFSLPAVSSRQEVTPWVAPEGMLAEIAPRIRDPAARATAVVEAVHHRGAHPALLAVGDLVHHFLPGPAAPRTTGRTTVLILTSRHREGELVQLVVVERKGPPGIALDALAGPFTRADAAFGAAVEAAWRATRSPSLSARWAVISDRTGAALEVIEGRSVGAGAAVALRYLSCSDLPPLDPSWATRSRRDLFAATRSS